MPFDWSECLVLAEHISEPRIPIASVEARHRSAVSRAYYAAFGTAREAADAFGFPRNRKAPVEDHRKLPSFLRTQRLFGAARDLQMLRIWRNQCDYDDTVADLPRLCQDAIQAARAVLNGLP